MSFNRPTSGQTVLATDITQFADVLQRQSTQTETGKYFLRGSSYATNANMGNYIPSLNRGSTPVSVSIDEVDQGHVAGNANPPISDKLTSNGFLMYSSGNGVQTLWTVGGNWTITY